MEAGLEDDYQTFLIDNGINTFDYPMRHLPGASRLAPAERFIFDLMHMIPDGAGKSYGAVIVWCLVHYKYATMAELQDAQKTYPYPHIAGGKLPPLPDSLQKGTVETHVDDNGVSKQVHMPCADARLSHMNAGQTLVWMQHSVELFRPFIERRGGIPPKWWEAWKLYIHIMHMLMARRVSHNWAQKGAMLIQKFHALVIACPELINQFR